MPFEDRPAKSEPAPGSLKSYDAKKRGGGTWRVAE